MYQLIKSDLLGLLVRYNIYYAVAGNRVFFSYDVFYNFFNDQTAVMHHERITKILP